MKKFFSLIAAVLFAGSMMAESLLSIDFTQGQGEWTIDDVNLGGLEFVWSQSSQYGMKATGFVSGNHETESWLISPVIDLSAVTEATLAFSHARRYGDLSQLSVLAKVVGGEWTALEVSAWPDGSSWNFVDATADLSAFAGQAAVQVAFKYTSTTEGGATWEIKKVAINDGGEVTPPEEGDVVFLPADFAGQGVEQTGGDVSTTKDGVTVSANKAYGHNLALRCYKNSSLSVVSTGEQIGKIEFQFYSTYNGGLSETVVVNAQEWSVESLSAQARIEKLKVYFGEFEPEPEPEVESITVAQALEIGKALQVSDKNNKYPSEKSYLIKGYTCAIETPFDETYKNETFWISDTKGTRTNDKAVAFEVYRGKPNTEKEIGIDALVQFTCKILNFNGTIENYDSNLAVEVIEQGTEEEVESINVAKALEIGKALEDKAVSPVKYEVTGYVSHIYSFYSQDFGNETVWISDDPESTSTENAFEIYRGKPNTKAEVGWGAKVKIVCQIKNFGGTIENDGTNLPFEVLEASTYVPDTVNIEEAVEIANALGDDVKTPKYHVVKGYIQDAPLPYNYKGSDNKWKNTTIKMSQFPNESEGPLAVYKANILKADTVKLVPNSYAYVLGYLTKHSGAAQIAEGSNVEFADAPKVDTIRVNVAEAIAAGLALPVEGKSEAVYAVTGYVNFVAEDFAEGKESFFIADAADSEEFNFYVANASIAEAAAIGQRIEVVGYLQNADGETVSIENGKARLLWPEGIENVVLTEKVQKVVVDGMIYIVRDGKMFDIRGTQVR